jgi:TolB-like protein
VYYGREGQAANDWGAGEASKYLRMEPAAVEGMSGGPVVRSDDGALVDIVHGNRLSSHPGATENYFVPLTKFADKLRTFVDPCVVPAEVLSRHQASDRPRIAILAFKNLTTAQDFDYLEKGMAESLSTLMAASGRYSLVERSQIDAALAEQEFQHSPHVNPETAVELGKILGVDHVIIGSFQKVENWILINARRVSAETGQVYEAASVQGLISNVFRTQSEVAEKLMKSIPQ